MLQASVANVLSVFQTYVASVFIWMLLCFTHMLEVFYPGCCKIRLGGCTCCNDCIRILQVSISNVLSVFQTYVVSVFILTFHIFYT